MHRDGPRPRLCLLQARLQHHLDALVLLVVEQLVAERRIFQREHVRDDHGGRQFSLLDQLKQMVPASQQPLRNPHVSFLVAHVLLSNH